MAAPSTSEGGDEADIARRAAAAFDAEAERIDGKLAEKGVSLACRAGCAHCCQSLVSVTAQEVFAIAGHVETAFAEPERAALKAKIVAHADASARLGGGARMKAKLACPFLAPETLLCRIHPARPLTCRGMNSVDESVCRAALEAPESEIAIPTVLAYHRAVQTLYDRLGERLHAAGRSAASLEMTGALAALWRAPDAAGRWRAGEDVFADCRAGAISDAPIPRF